jgi:asparagine synthetase B (glutamine-hydrolysing)
MILTIRSITQVEPQVNRFDAGNRSFLWKGFVYIPGIPAGEQSMREFGCRMETAGLPAAACDLRGTFLVIVGDTKTGTYRAFVDHAGMYKAFYSDSAISTSLLELAQARSLRADDLDPETVVEAIRLGGVFDSRTVFRSIAKIARDQIVRLGPDGRTTIEPKPVGGIDQPARTGFLDYFECLAQSLAHERLSADLTGGTDSRTMVALLHYTGVNFETAISGMPDNADIRISTEVARGLGHQHHVTLHNIDRFEDELPDLLEAIDAQGSILDYHRRAQYQQGRKTRGVTVAFGAGSGTFLKDNLWFHEFPFYHRAQADLGRLYDYRIEPVRHAGRCFAGQYEEASRHQRDRWLRLLRCHQLGSNTQTIDNIVWGLKHAEIEGRGHTNAINRYFGSYDPFADLDLIRLAFHLPRREHFLELYERRAVSRYAPRVARIHTGEGTTVSAAAGDIARDLGGYWVDKTRRLVRKLGQLALNRTLFRCNDNPDHPDMIRRLRRSALARRLIATGKDAGILNPDLDVDTLPAAYLGNCVTLGFLLERLGR